MDTPLVLIGCPVRNRAWVLPAYLKALEALEYPPERIRFAFIVNDCEDASAEILQEFARYRPTAVVRQDLHYPKWNRGHYSYANLALLRNRLLVEALAAGVDYLFSVDSDVLVPPHALQRLLCTGHSLIAARVPNDLHMTRSRGRCNFLRYSSRHGRMVHVLEVPPNAIIPVDVAGAAILISRAVMTAGCRYSPGFTGEDEGFCLMAKERGFPVWVDTGLVCRHCMFPPT